MPVRKRGLLAISLVLVLDLSPQQGLAAWTQARGEGLIISSLSHYRSEARFDAAGKRAEAGGYEKQELSVYGIYGVTDALTLGAQPVLTRVHARSAFGGGRQNMLAFSQIEFFARQRVVAGENWVVSAQGLVKLAAPDAVDREPLLETSRREMEGRLLYGRSGRTGKYLLDLEYFSSLETGLRARSNGAASQWRGDAAFGVRFQKHYQLIGQSINSISLRELDVSDASAFDLYKAQISLLRDLPRGVSVQMGAAREYAGRNISSGGALFMAIWSRF